MTRYSFASILALACIATALIFNTAAAQQSTLTLDELLAKILEANGGQKSIDDARSLRVTGKIENDEMSYDFVLLKKRPHFMRITLLYQGRTIESGYNGSKAWREVRVGEESEVELLDEKAAQSLTNDLDFDGPLIGPVAEGVKRRLEGVERIDRIEYFIVEITGKEDKTRHWVDSRTYRELKTEAERMQEDGTVRRTTSYFKDYRKLGTIWMAYRIERTTEGQGTETILIENAELNPGLFDILFDVPVRK